MMDLARARRIVSAINDRCLAHVGLPRNLATLKNISLADMMEAKRVVENANEAAEAAARITGEQYRVSMVPDDRLLAAVYCIDHFPASDEPALQIPDGDNHLLCLAVIRLRTPVEADDESELAEIED
jgi:hypothetical protein